MKLFTLQTPYMCVNSYFLINEESNNAVLIDGGEDYNAIKKVENELGISVTHLLLTHGHFDHAGNARELQKDGIKVGISLQDAPKLSNEDNLCKDFNRLFDALVPDFTFVDGDILSFNGIDIKVMLTAGHTSGSCCFIVEDMIFSGDTLFRETFGRTDMKDGNLYQMMKSIKKLIQLQGEYKVFPGHNEATTLSHEREYNPMARYVKK